MKIIFCVAAAVTLGFAPLQAASAAVVEVATGDWSSIHWMKSRSFNIISADAVERVHRAFAKGECKLAGQTKKRLNLTVPFLVQYGSGGALQRVVLRKLGCPTVESILGGVLLEQVRGKEYQPTEQNPAGWYRGELRLTST